MIMVNGTEQYVPYVPKFDDFGIPTAYAAMCKVGHFSAPSEHYFFQNNLESINDPEHAAQFFKQLSQSVGAFENHFDKYAEYCEPSALDLPCELFRYDETTTEQEVVGTLITVIAHVVSNCVSGFGWQWVTTAQALAAASSCCPSGRAAQAGAKRLEERAPPRRPARRRARRRSSN